MKPIVWGIILILLATAVVAENSMTLLAVKETSEGFEGSIAELTLEIKEGKGRVFLETSPFTKIDTQVSTRMAKEISCEYLNIDCSNLDFIYTIKSEAPIVGGPSAGASISVLTIASLKELDFENFAITGTINSGGIIGQVGGIKEKIEAAETKGIKKVLIPAGEMPNSSILENVDIEIIEVETLNQAVIEFTGKSFIQEYEGDVEINKQYSEIMKKVAKKLCNESNSTEELFKREAFYSAASKCFSQNIREDYNETKDEFYELKKEIKKFKEEINDIEIDSIPKLQTYMIVRQRISEAEESDNYVFARERLRSAKSWSEFFAMDGKKLVIDKNILKQSCLSKISEAEERLQYVATFSELIDYDDDELKNAKENYNNQEYALCLHTASLAKANADTIISSIGSENVTNLIDLKLKVAKQNIIREQERGFFPIAGYSYYEYANILKNESVYSSLLFSQYALELSSFDVYFNDENIQISVDERGYEYVLIYLIGIITGVVITWMVFARN